MIYLQDHHIRAVCKFIHTALTQNEPAPDYENETSGIGNILKVLDFIRNDDYYPTFEEKAAYLLCSVAGAQYFTNGNKRFAIVLLLSFLGANDTDVPELSQTEFKVFIDKMFPRHQWEENAHIHGSHAMFLYNLATIIGNPPVWGTDKFNEMRGKVASMFEMIYRLPE